MNFIRHNAGVAALIIVCLGIAGGFHALNREAEQRVAAVRTEARARSRVDRARTAQVDWDAQTARHRACRARSESQVASREAWRVAVVLLSTPRPGESLQRRAETVRTVAGLNSKLDKALEPQDCSKVSPKPKGPRPRIP